jgi:hypothetical protein
LDCGLYSSVADMAKAENIDRCHIYRYLRLLSRLHPEAIEAVEALGDFYEGRLITQKDLGPIILLPDPQHKKAVCDIIKMREGLYRQAVNRSPEGR